MKQVIFDDYIEDPQDFFNAVCYNTIGTTPEFWKMMEDPFKLTDELDESNDHGSTKEIGVLGVLFFPENLKSAPKKFIPPKSPMASNIKPTRPKEKNRHSARQPRDKGNRKDYFRRFTPLKMAIAA